MQTNQNETPPENNQQHRSFWSKPKVRATGRIVLDIVIFVGIAYAVLYIWKEGWTWIDSNIKSENLALQTNEGARGTFGDKFGAINALFSGLAFAGIIATILLQRRELFLQRKDLEEQNRTFRHQRFENSFFQLLSLHSKTISQLEVNGRPQQDAFKYFTETLKSSSHTFAAFQPISHLTPEQRHQIKATNTLSPEMHSSLTTAELNTLTSSIENAPGCVSEYFDESFEFHQNLIRVAYLKTHEISNNGFSHYFRNLYHIYRFLDEAENLTDSEKKRYSRIIRAQLSNEELLATLYNCLAPRTAHQEFGFPKMLRLVREYDILQNIDQRSVLHPIHLRMIKEIKLEES